MREWKVRRKSKIVFSPSYEREFFWTSFDKRLTNIYIDPTMADKQEDIL